MRSSNLMERGLGLFIVRNGTHKGSCAMAVSFQTMPNMAGSVVLALCFSCASSVAKACFFKTKERFASPKDVMPKPA